MLAAVYVTNGDLKSSNPDANQQPSLTGTGAGILGLSYSAFTVSSGATANVSLTRVTDLFTSRKFYCEGWVYKCVDLVR